MNYRRACRRVCANASSLTTADRARTWLASSASSQRRAGRREARRLGHPTREGQGAGVREGEVDVRSRDRHAAARIVANVEQIIRRRIRELANIPRDPLRTEEVREKARAGVKGLLGDEVLIIEDSEAVFAQIDLRRWLLSGYNPGAQESAPRLHPLRFVLV